MNINIINFVAENIFDELVLNEKISSEQKEKGQRIMQKLETNVFYRLKKQLEKDWEDKSVTKENLKKKKAEFDKLRELIKIGEHLKLSNDKETEKYLSKNSVLPIKWSIKNNDIPNSAGALDPSAGKYPTLKFSDVSLDNHNLPFDLGLINYNNDIEKVIKTFAALHEYGHLYNYLYELIKTGKAEVVSTLSGGALKVANSEGKANAYAFDNMYRKDRRELLKNSSYDKESLIRARQRTLLGLSYGNGVSASDLYKVGTKNKSKTLEKTLNSIEKENRKK